ncbi:hypothetical protein [Nitrosospira sp. Is2]|uniref:hypothetical protein n=1 Tax=Nitrosospira sp. Is2 TaxID=3080532 RepID=UPI0029547E48|nr:hypothetical protein [Nitrosospira sp. Is2]WON75332.1 hypothetical protein R5L00_07620 [Nitrosospira sp. Is2]
MRINYHSRTRTTFFWKFRRAQRDQIIAELGRQWDAGIASGLATEGNEAFSRVRARLDAKLSGHRPA